MGWHHYVPLHSSQGGHKLDAEWATSHNGFGRRTVGTFADVDWINSS